MPKQSQNQRYKKKHKEYENIRKESNYTGRITL